MKLTIPAKQFSGAMQAVGKIVERRNTIPILSNVLLTASPGHLQLRATDLDIEISISIEANVTEPGSTTVASSLLSDILRKYAADAEVKFSANDQSADVSSGRSRFSLQTLPETDFPAMSVTNMHSTLRIAGAALATALGQVAFAISTEETRYYLNGVYFHVDPVATDKLTMAATDGHRLARTRCAVESGLGEWSGGIIVPRKTVAELRNLAKAAGDQIIEMEVSDSKIRVTTPSNTVLTSKLIDGSFPEYQRVIPALSNQVAEVEAKSFSTAIDRVSTISSERSRAIKLTFKAGEIALEVNNPDMGTAKEEMETSYEGAPVEIGFNSRYVVDILSVLGSEKARIFLTDAGSPTIFQREQDDQSLYVLMPMRV